MAEVIVTRTGLRDRQRACHTPLALEHAGRLGAALDVGSWSEWP